MIRLIGYLFRACVRLGPGRRGRRRVYLANVLKDLPDYAVLSSYAPPVTAFRWQQRASAKMHA